MTTFCLDTRPSLSVHYFFKPKQTGIVIWSVRHVVLTTLPSVNFAGPPVYLSPSHLKACGYPKQIAATINQCFSFRCLLFLLVSCLSAVSKQLLVHYCHLLKWNVGLQNTISQAPELTLSKNKNRNLKLNKHFSSKKKKVYHI